MHIQIINNAFERAIILVDCDSSNNSSQKTNYASDKTLEEKGHPMEFTLDEVDTKEMGCE